MLASLLPLYHRLPPVVRSSVATARGFYLRHWRYGAETDRLVQDARERESWSEEKWAAWRVRQVGQLLRRAATRVPYYRDLWARRRQAGDARSWEDLDNWPILEKEDLRRDPTAFLADDCKPAGMFLNQTSGTSGTPLRLWQSRATVRGWYALFEARWRQWHGVSRHDRWAILGGQLVTPVEQRRPPFWVCNHGLHQLYLSSYHLAPDLIPYYVEELRRFRPVYLWGYSSSLYTLAQECLRLGVDDLRFKVVLTNAEPLYDYQREVIEKAFTSPVRETYGMCEMVAAASECEAGRLHLWPEAGVLEVVDADETGTGDLVATGLVNQDMPLIRYRIGDRGRLGNGHDKCACGRGLPILEKVEGRSDDTLVTSDGRRIGRLDPVFKAGLPIREAQIIQEALDRVRVLVVPAEGFNTHHADEVSAKLSARLGQVQVIVEQVNEISRGPNCKFRAVISRLPKDQA